jgi:hypothetical protein
MIEIEKDVHELCKRARKLAEKYRTDPVFIKYYSKRNRGHKMTAKENKFFINYTKLFAISMIDEYEKINVQQSRELMRVNAIGIDSLLQLSGKESACIKLYTGTKEYQESWE